MAIIKQLKQLFSGTKIYPVTKSNAIYDDNLGRLDTILSKSANIDTKSMNISTDGSSYNIVDPSTGNRIMPITNTNAIFDNTHGRLDTYLATLITSGTQDLVDGQSKLESGTIYVVYK